MSPYSQHQSSQTGLLITNQCVIDGDFVLHLHTAGRPVRDRFESVILKAAETLIPSIHQAPNTLGFSLPIMQLSIIISTSIPDKHPQLLNITLSHRRCSTTCQLL